MISTIIRIFSQIKGGGADDVVPWTFGAFFLQVLTTQF